MFKLFWGSSRKTFQSSSCVGNIAIQFANPNFLRNAATRLIRLIFLLFLKCDSSWWMLPLLTACCLILRKLCWFSGFLLIITGEILFKFLGGDAYFLFWRFAVCNWPTLPTSSLLGPSTVRWLNLFDVLIINQCHYFLLSVSLDL